ncbi:hypothetical protein [uncultured Amphritea sp.]|uniref:hypothetical protein n=1 Tax=uncultured Amphritea sp. TaxID=981605 RepID=UPI00260A0AEA|nr:hypothetical protein [uncultured Amphritea sp.]
MVILTLLLLFAFVASGCSQNLQPTLPDNKLSASCIPALTALQQLSIRHIGIQQGEVMPGAPWLRSNRLVDHFAHQTELSDPQLGDLLSYMSHLASASLTRESQLLPASQRQQWQQHFNVADPGSYIDGCSEELVQQQLLTPDNTRQWLDSLPADNDYQPLARIAGLYPLTALLFKQGVIREHQWLQQQPDELQNSAWQTYTPQIIQTSAPDLKAAARNSLGIATLPPAIEQALFDYHAPLWRLPDNQPVNRPGHPYWDETGLQVNQLPVSFTYLSHGIYHQQTTLQLNYLIWFPERQPTGLFDLVAGKHDAVIFRVHLTQSGEVLAYDSIHLCGCWYSLILPEEQRYTATTELYREPTFVLHTDKGRQLISLTSNSHLLIASQKSDLTPSGSKQYQLLPFTDLLQLATKDSPRSVFNPEGYVAGSERPERWLFWPMGISNPGALRRPGDHAIRFIGTLHFDDPLILEKLGL